MPLNQVGPERKISAHFATEEVDKVGLLVTEQVDEDLILHLRKGDPDGSPGQKDRGQVLGSSTLLGIKGLFCSLKDSLI